MDKKFIPIIISDVDGVLSGKQFLCDVNGKTHKIFGCGDKEGIVMLQQSGWEIIFVSSDKSGYPIVEKRVSHLKCKCQELSSNFRDEYVQKFRNQGYWPIVYIGDSVSDVPALKCADISFVPNDARIEAKRSSTFVVKSNSASGVFGDVAAVLLDMYDYTNNKLKDQINGFLEDYIDSSFYKVKEA